MFWVDKTSASFFDAISGKKLPRIRIITRVFVYSHLQYHNMEKGGEMEGAWEENQKTNDL